MQKKNNHFKKTKKGAFLVQLDQIIIDNLSNVDFSIHQLKQEFFLCDSQIYRKIKQKSGHSPSVYIRNIRLQYAHELIQQSDLTLSQIAHTVGFSGLPYFSRCFSGYYGYPPSAVRSF